MSGISPMSNQAFTNAVSPFGAPEGNSYDSLAALRGEVYPGELAGDTVHLSSQEGIFPLAEKVNDKNPGLIGTAVDVISNGLFSWSALISGGLVSIGAGLMKVSLKKNIIASAIVGFGVGNAMAFFWPKATEAHNSEKHH